MADLDPNADSWEVRLEPLDLDAGVYTVMLHDPATWTQSGPYYLRFPIVDAAFHWLQEFAHIDTLANSMGHLARGEFVQGTASPTLWAGMISALAHCAHHPGYIASEWWSGSTPPWQQDSPYAPANVPGGAPVLAQRAPAADLDLLDSLVPDLRTHALADLTDDDQGWTRLIEFVAALVALTDDVVVVSVDTRHYQDGDAYVQLCREDNGGLTLEAVSSQFLDPPLPLDAINALHDLGWQDPPGDGLPNYIQQLDAGSTAPGDVAALLVQTLRIAYSAEPGDLYQFAPQPLTEQLLHGDFGPRFMLDPHMPEARKARRYLGIRFPNDLAS
jgi:hypothetical protein